MSRAVKQEKLKCPLLVVLKLKEGKSIVTGKNRKKFVKDEKNTRVEKFTKEAYIK